jgi:hypothetical protein
MRGEDGDLYILDVNRILDCNTKISFWISCVLFIFPSFDLVSQDLDSVFLVPLEDFCS